MTMLEKTNKLVWLFDFYGELLTKRQKEIFELYYYEDLSLGEISEHYHISRQAIYDLLKRGETLLYQYEEKLGMLEHYLKQEQQLRKLRSILEKSLTEDKRKECLGLLDEIIRGEH